MRKETKTWSKWSNIILSSGQNLRLLSLKTGTFEEREDLFLCARRVLCIFSLKLVDGLLKADSVSSHHVESIFKI